MYDKTHLFLIRAVSESEWIPDASFWLNQAKGMVSPTYHKQKSFPFRVEQSYVIAISSLSYLLPAIWMIYVIERWNKWIDFTVYSMMSMISLFGDYFYVDTSHLNGTLHFMDQWTATSAITLNFYKCYAFWDSSLDFIWIFGLSLPAFKLLQWSRSAQCMKTWIFYHSIWHFWGSLICFVVVYNEWNFTHSPAKKYL